MSVHILKLCVGIEDIEMLREAQAGRLRQADGRAFVPGFTRRKPRRALEIIGSGSIYWIIRGTIQVRQCILDLVDAVDGEGTPYCELRLDPDLVAVEPRRHRPFQGWRYFKHSDAPPDLNRVEGDDEMPAEMAAELRILGLI